MLDNHELDDRRRQREQARLEEQRQRAKDLLLQVALTALEQGVPLESVLEGVRRQGETLRSAKNERSSKFDRGGRQAPPAGNGERHLQEPMALTPDPKSDLQELESLVKLAAAVRQLPHPLPHTGWAHQRSLPDASQRPANGRYTNHNERQTTLNSELPTQPKSNIPKPDWPANAWREAGLKNSPGRLQTAAHRRQAVLLPLFAPLAILLIFALSLAWMVWQAGPRGAQAATLMDTRGQVAALGQDGSWTALADGDQVSSGQRLRTGPGSRVTLVFFDGTRTTLEPNSDVTLTQVGGDWGSVLRVTLIQNTGRTIHSVVPLRGERSAFSVLTPSGVASVHGTNFDVAVDAGGRSRFGVKAGRVLVSSEMAEVFLTAGQATLAQADGALEDPAYQFTLQGTLNYAQGSTWIVDNVPFTVLPETAVSGNPQVGSEVRVAGRVLASGEWVADSIEPVETLGDTEGDSENLSSFTGTLQAMNGDVWQIGAWTVVVDTATELGAGLEVGKAVQVTFQLMEDGRWLAVRIELLEEPEEGEPTTEPTTQPTDTSAQPILAFSPAELRSGICTAGEVNFSGTLSNTAAGEANTATDVELAYQVGAGAEFVDWVELDPVQFASIPAGESASFTVRLALKESWEAAGGSKIELRVFVIGAEGTRLTINIENECEETPAPDDTETPAVTDTPVITETETVTPTITLTPVITITETVTPTLTETPTITVTETTTPTVEVIPESTSVPETSCTGAQPHPVGLGLAEKYGVPYTEIMDWFCGGFGFGEIDLAYSLSWVSGQPVAEIFAMKTGGMGWGEIMQELEVRGNPKKWATPPPETAVPGSPEIQSTPVPGNPQVQSTPVPPGNSNGKPDQPGRPDNPGNSGNPGNPGNPGNSGNPGRPDNPGNSKKP